MQSQPGFAAYCCELLASVGTLKARRMFGGWGLSLDGLTLALVADLGSGERLWLKADAASAGRFEAAQCLRFSYGVRQGDSTVQRGINYYSPPDEAMDSTQAMAPWAQLALESALKARAASGTRGTLKRRKAAKRGAG